MDASPPVTHAGDARECLETHARKSVDLRNLHSDSSPVTGMHTPPQISFDIKSLAALGGRVPRVPHSSALWLLHCRGTYRPREHRWD